MDNEDFLSCRGCPVRSASICGGGNLLTSRSDVHTVKAGHAVQRRSGNTAEPWCTIVEGWAFRWRKTGHGRRQILAFILPGDFLGLPDVSRELGAAFQGGSAVEAITELRVCMFPRDRVEDFLYGGADGPALLNASIARDLSGYEDRLVDLGRRTAFQRIASLLIDLATRLKARGLTEGDTLFFPPRQEHLADALGLTQVHVSRVLTDLKSRGLIRLAQRRLAILDWPGLVQAAGLTESELARIRAFQTLWDWDGGEPRLAINVASSAR